MIQLLPTPAIDGAKETFSLLMILLLHDIFQILLMKFQHLGSISDGFYRKNVWNILLAN